MSNFGNTLKTNLIYVFLGILALNVAILDYMVFFGSPRGIVQNINVGNKTASSMPQTSTTSQTTASQNGTTQQFAASCPNACLAVIKTATESMKLTQTVVNNTTTQSAAVSSTPQEYFIPFGATSGVSQGSYTTLPALQAYINTSLYQNIQSITLEVSATIPNGNQSISIQLYNATDGYAITNSQVTMSGGTPQLLISPNLTLPTGNKLYQVQINTQLNSSITIDQARLHITTN